MKESKRPSKPDAFLKNLMSQVDRKQLELIVAILLSLSVLPSFTALSVTLGKGLGKASDYLGPLNFIKVFFPVLILYLGYLWISLPERVTLTKKFLNTRPAKVIVGSLGILVLSTLIAGIPCGFPKSLVREAAAMFMGAMVAASFICLPDARKHLVLKVWFGILFVTVLLDLFAPSTIDWMYANLFDPSTRDLDYEEVKRRVLTGVFGRQSLAKLLVWLPWLFSALGIYSRYFKNGKILGLIFVGLAAGLTLATSQRGPFLAANLSFLVYALHERIQLKNKKALLVAGGLLFGAALLTLIVVPRDILESRLRSLVGVQRQTVLDRQAGDNSRFRYLMYRFSWDIVKTHPFGNACIPTGDFWKAGLSGTGHAHNLFLHQFRERGWLWGLAHMLLWLLPIPALWRNKKVGSSAFLAGYIGVLLTGMFDSPWPVINHSIILCIYLMVAWMNVYSQDSRKEFS